MRYTTHGYMTGLDLDDHHRLYDTGPHPDCPGHPDTGVPYDTIVYCSRAEDCPEAGQEEETP